MPLNSISEESLEKFEANLEVMNSLNHPNIINNISGWVDKLKGEIVLITETMGGRDLKKHIQKIKRPRLKLIKHWIRSILEGLHYLHTQVQPPIIHRNIKCENIYIDAGDGSIKIGDIGILNQSSEELSNTSVNNTVESDLYSLGMCILQMISGEKSFKAQSVSIIIIIRI